MPNEVRHFPTITETATQPLDDIRWNYVAQGIEVRFTHAASAVYGIQPQVEVSRPPQLSENVQPFTAGLPGFCMSVVAPVEHDAARKQLQQAHTKLYYAEGIVLYGFNDDTINAFLSLTATERDEPDQQIKGIARVFNDEVASKWAKRLYDRNDTEAFSEAAAKIVSGLTCVTSHQAVENYFKESNGRDPSRQADLNMANYFSKIVSRYMSRLLNVSIA
jgi:hypothetical protein